MKYLPHTILLLVGMAGGYFGKSLLSSDSKKPHESKPSIQKAPISTKSIVTSFNEARAYSLRYRMDARVGYCPVPNSRYIAVSVSQLGFMRLSYNNISDLKSAADAIRLAQTNGHSYVSTEFRLIYGMDASNPPVVSLLVAGLDGTGREIQQVAGQNIIHRLQYGIECPIQCDLDFARSEIITGQYLNAAPNDASYRGSCQ